VNGFWATFLRELRAFFVSPLAYVVLFFLLAVNGVLFAIIVLLLNGPQAPAVRPIDLFFNNVFFWLVQLAIAPLLTMRLLAEERRSGSIEVLMTAPVTEGQVVAGKYLAAFVFYLVVWLPTVAYAVVVDRFSDVDWGAVAAGYLGIALSGALFLSIGMVGSAVSKNQINAAVITFALNLLVFMLVLLTNVVNAPGLQDLFGHLSIAEHMEEFWKGIVDTRRLVFYLSTTLFFLWFASRALEDRKWR
jgi:ABC-2 type transport system permease protein